MSKRKVIPLLIYILFLLVPIYWLLNMSFKSNTEILGGLTLFPQDFTLANYKVIFTDPSWYTGYLNSLYYVSLNTVISLTVALPAAYAFSRYRFLGDKHLFFWLLTNRMKAAGGVPVAVFPAVFVHWPVRYPYRRGPGPLPVQRTAGGVDPGRLYVRGAQGDRRNGLH